jgi:uncharacterized protein
MSRVAIIGASDNHDRYSYLALKELQKNGHEVLLVSPKLSEIDNIPVSSNINDLQKVVDVVTMYVNPKISSSMGQDLINLAPKSVIFNPGTENSDLQDQLSKAGINCVEACTLVLLKTKQFHIVL